LTAIRSGSDGFRPLLALAAARQDRAESSLLDADVEAADVVPADGAPPQESVVAAIAAPRTVAEWRKALFIGRTTVTPFTRGP
jgi:hypothetical protein